MSISLNSPNTDNYAVGKGVLRMVMPGDLAPTDLGNAPEIELTFNIERLDHFSSRAGVRSKDRSIVLEKGGTLRVVLEEITARNMSLAMMGARDESDPAAVTIDVLSESSIICEVHFESTNAVGPRWNMVFPRVEFVPSGSLNLISEEWQQIEVEGEVLYDEESGSFGTATANFAESGS